MRLTKQGRGVSSPAHAAPRLLVQPRLRSRGGFTLVEILVVVAILALLTALTAGGVQSVRIAQMKRTTDTTVGKCQTGVDTQVKAISDQIVKERANRNARSKDFDTFVGYCDGDEDRAAALLTYCRLRQAFPQTATELASGGFSIGSVGFPRPQAFAPLAGINGPAEHVAAAVLYVALSKRTLAGNEFAGEGTAGAEMDITLNGISCRVYKDAWANPITFQRFAQSAELNTPDYANAKTGLLDPFDPLGKLAGNWTNKAAIEASFGGAGFFNNQNRAFVVYSAGQNQQYNGLVPGTDDILGYRLRKIGARGAKQ